MIRKNELFHCSTDTFLQFSITRCKQVDKKEKKHNFNSEKYVTLMDHAFGNMPLQFTATLTAYHFFHQSIVFKQCICITRIQFPYHCISYWISSLLELLIFMNFFVSFESRMSFFFFLSSRDWTLITLLFNLFPWNFEVLRAKKRKRMEAVAYLHDLPEILKDPIQSWNFSVIFNFVQTNYWFSATAQTFWLRTDTS